MEDWQSNRSNELYKRNKKKKKKNNVRNSDGQEEEANGGCWVKLRVMLCCVASTSDVHSSLSLSTTTGMSRAIYYSVPFEFKRGKDFPFGMQSS